MRCRKCNEELYNNQNYCRKCGTKILKEKDYKEIKELTIFSIILFFLPYIIFFIKIYFQYITKTISVFGTFLTSFLLQITKIGNLAGFILMIYIRVKYKTKSSTILLITDIIIYILTIIFFFLSIFFISYLIIDFLSQL